MSYASYISRFLRENGFAPHLDNKLLSVKQDPNNPSTAANVCMGSDRGFEERKTAFYAAKDKLVNAGFSIPMAGAGAFKVTGPAKLAGIGAAVNQRMDAVAGHIKSQKRSPSSTRSTPSTDIGAELNKRLDDMGDYIKTLKRPTAFDEWLTRFVNEKELDTEYRFDVEGPKGGRGWNSIPLGVVLEACRTASPQEQAQIKNTLVKIDVLNGDVMHFFKHLAQGMAK